MARQSLDIPTYSREWSKAIGRMPRHEKIAMALSGATLVLLVVVLRMSLVVAGHTKQLETIRANSESSTHTSSPVASSIRVTMNDRFVEQSNITSPIVRLSSWTFAAFCWGLYHTVGMALLWLLAFVFRIAVVVGFALLLGWHYWRKQTTSFLAILHSRWPILRTFLVSWSLVLWRWLTLATKPQTPVAFPTHLRSNSQMRSSQSDSDSDSEEPIRPKMRLEPLEDIMDNPLRNNTDISQQLFLAADRSPFVEKSNLFDKSKNTSRNYRETTASHWPGRRWLDDLSPVPCARRKKPSLTNYKLCHTQLRGSSTLAVENAPAADSPNGSRFSTPRVSSLSMESHDHVRLRKKNHL